MNKIVNELFNRAGGWTEVCDVSGEEILTYNENLDPEKFAELIIKECADAILKVLEDDRMQKSMDPEMFKFMKNIGGHYSIFLRGHFGVQ
jgi:hypothetical protein